MTRRIMVTGGAGLVGATVTRLLLDRGDEVTVLDSGVAAGFAALDGTAARVVRGDIRDQEAVRDAMSDCSAIIHLAAQASVPGSIAAPVDDLEINVRGSLNLLECARAAGIRRFVFSSSSSVVAGHPPPTHELLVPRPVSPYGAAKGSVEAYLKAYTAAYGLEGVSLRFSNAYGPWSRHKTSVVASFIRAYLYGGPLIVKGDGTQTRDFVHTSDVAAAVLAALDAPADSVAGEVFQVATGVETSLLALAELIFEAGGGSVPIEHQPPSAGDVSRNVSDISKARRVLAYEPGVELAEGVAATLHWFRAQSGG
jgi:UDP-glucose 4-epimerase